jgi:hypothetical protein
MTMRSRAFEINANWRAKASAEADIRAKAAKANREARLRAVEKAQFERGYN